MKNNFLQNSKLIISLYRQQHPLRFILLIAVALRILAAFFSKGFVFSDDHYCVIEQAQDWLLGFSHGLDLHDPPLHSIFYSGLHYVLFYLLEHVGIVSPDIKMTINRLIHGLYSVLLVYYSYKITDLISGRKNAELVGMVLATLWFLLFLCTKDLVEAVSIPLCLAGFYYLIRMDITQKQNYMDWLLTGILFGFAFLLRMHTILFAGGIGLVLLYRRQWMGSILFSIGYLLTAGIIQGTIDYVFFEYPFHSLVAYYEYNAANAYNYITLPFYQFLIVIIGFLIPPVSLFLIYGFVRARKVEPLMFTAGLLFFLFHSYFPNKQERFILPLLPIIVIMGIIGWQEYVSHSDYWKDRTKLFKISWRFFWTVNFILGIFLIFTYSKKSRIEPLVYLSGKHDLKAFIIETQENNVDEPPVFYLGKFASTYPYFKGRLAEIKKLESEGKLKAKDCIILYDLPITKSTETLEAEIKDLNKQPQYIVFHGADQLERRIERVKQLFPDITFETQISPALYDEVLHFLNPPIHKDQHVSIYKIN